MVALWASLLSVPLPDNHPPLNLTPQRQKQKTLEAILASLLALAAERPVVFVVEDLHWVDPSTPELLGVSMWGIYFGEFKEPFKHTRRYKISHWFSEQFWIDFAVDILTLLSFAVATWRGYQILVT